MKSIMKHWPRVAVSLLPLIFALLHATGIMRLDMLQRLDDMIYDFRLNATAPRTLDPRIVIVDIDEKSLSEVGRWPWSRKYLASMVDELFDQQKIAVLGFDVVFAEADSSSGLSQLNALAKNELKDQAGFKESLRGLQTSLDYDALFAKSLKNRPVVMGYFLNDSEGSPSGVLPSPVLNKGSLEGRTIQAYRWNSYGSNIAELAKAAPTAGYFNPVIDHDGVVRSLPMLAQYQGQYYESLSLAMVRMLMGSPPVVPGYSFDGAASGQSSNIDLLRLRLDGKHLDIPVDEKVAALVPYRGHGNVAGGSFQYIPASDILNHRLPPGSLKDKIVLVGTTAQGLLDLRVTPMDETYPGVEIHANLISALLDGKTLLRPDVAQSYEVGSLILAGLVLAIALPFLSALQGVALNLVVVATLAGLNFWLYQVDGWVLPLAASLSMAPLAFALNMSYGYFVESRTKRELANLFGTYVPPELVGEMLKDPDAYTMKASNRELTVMFSDMRGFTAMSEKMEPTQLQELLTGVFSNLTALIRANRGTIDKYMGDCVMAFWGAPVETPDHAQLSVKSAIAMAHAVRGINDEHRARGLPEIGIGIGLNTGTMCVGDMGSNIRRAYTVIGDSVNLGARLEGLSKAYGVDIVVSESTRNLAPDFSWQELDRVRVKGKAVAVAIFYPFAPAEQLSAELAQELETWGHCLKAYRAQDWEQADRLLVQLMAMNPTKYLYQLYADRVSTMRQLPFDPDWDGATNFETK